MLILQAPKHTRSLAEDKIVVIWQQSAQSSSVGRLLHWDIAVGPTACRPLSTYLKTGFLAFEKSTSIGQTPKSLNSASEVHGQTAFTGIFKNYHRIRG